MNEGASAGAWRFVAASAIGSDHERAAMPCQDAALARLVPHGAGERLVCVASDGAGSARWAEVGARLACEAALPVLAAAEPPAAGEADTLGARVVAAVQAAIAAEAAARGGGARDLACTLLGAVAAPGWSVFVQVGDGVIVAAAPGEATHAWIFWPDKGEHANETSFVTASDAAERIAVQWRGAVDELAVLSDGLERLALDFERRAAHAPFFGPMFAAVRGLAPGDAAEAEALTGELVGFLASPRVNERTGDDKTLVLATRRAR